MALSCLEKGRRSPGLWGLPRLLGTLGGKIVPTKRNGVMELSARQA
jgi:hypothetical protein